MNSVIIAETPSVVWKKNFQASIPCLFHCSELTASSEQLLLSEPLSPYNWAYNVLIVGFIAKVLSSTVKKTQSVSLTFF